MASDLIVDKLPFQIPHRYYGENAVEAEETKRFQEIVAEATRSGGATNIGDYLPFLRKIGFKGVEKNLQALQEKRDRFMHSLLEEQKTRETNSDKGKTRTLMQVLLSLQETEPEFYSDVTIRSIMSVSPVYRFLLPKLN